MDLWSILGLQLIALIGGAVTGAVALMLGGAGSVRVISTRLDLLEEAVDHTDQRLTSEVKKRASQVAVEKRRSAASVEEEAKQVLLAHPDAGKGVSDAPRGNKRPSVMRAGSHRPI